jgi:hypothetical protein
VLSNNTKTRGGNPVTPKQLHTITDDIKDDWKFIGRYLGLQENTIKEIQQNHDGNTYDQANEVLLKWQRSNASGATTQVLIRALQDVDKQNVVRKVQGW